MRAAIITRGAEFGTPLLQAYRTSKNDYFHSSVLYAVAGAEDADFLDSVFDMALTPQMHIGDIRYLYYYMGNEPVARAALWRWYQAHYDALLQRVTAEEMPRAIGLFSEVCDAGLRDEAERFFRPKVKALPGLKRRLALSRETINRCLAFKDAKGRDLRAALTARQN
jgi:alanyl aminopeptidase